MKNQEENISALLIEDNLADARLLYEFVRETRDIIVNLEHVTKLSSGIDQLKSKQYDIIIADLRLTDAYGLEILEKIREVDDKTPIVVLSGYEDEELYIQSIKIGAQDYILKNLMDSATIVRSIRYAIERKKIENQLIQNEENFRMIFDQAAVGIGYLDLEGNWTKLNSKLAEILNTEEDNPKKLTFNDFINNQIDLDNLLKGKYDFITKEIEIKKNENESDCYDVTLSKVKDINDNPVNLISVIVNINDKKLSEEQIRFSEEKFRLITENSREMIFMMNDKDEVIYVNPSVTQIMGYKSEFFNDRSRFDIVHPDDIETVKTIKDAKNKRYRVKNINDEYIWIEGKTYRISTNGREYIVDIARDINEEKKAANLINESENKYRSLLGNMIQGVIYHDEEGKIIFANPAAEKILDVSSEVMLNKKISDLGLHLIREDGRKLTEEEYPINIALTTGMPVNDLIIGFSNPANDKTVWLNLNAVPQIKENETKPYQILETFSDITEIKLTQQELEQEKIKTEKIIDITSSLILVLDEKGKVVKINKKGTEILNLPANEIIGKNWIQNFVAESDLKKVEELFQKVISNKQEQKYFIYLIKSNNNEPRLILFSNTVLTENNKKFIISAGQDITEQNQYQKSLLQSEQKFKTAIEISSVGVAYLDSHGKIIDVNSKFASIINIAKDDLYQQNIKKIIDSILPEKHQKEFNDFLYGAYQSVSNEFCIKDCDGKNPVWVNFKISRINNEPDSNIIIMIEDVSGLKNIHSKVDRYEEQISKYYEEKGENSQKLAEFETNLYKANAGINKVFNSLYKDIKEPFSDVQSFAEYLYKNVNELDKNEIKNFAEKIYKNVKDTVENVSNLLQYSKLSSEDIEYLPVNFNIKNLAQEIIDSLKPHAFKDNLEFINEIPENTVVYADRNMIGNVLWNLLTNAIKYNNKDGKIYLAAKQTENNFEIIVEDTGVGIPKAKLENLFELDKSLSADNDQKTNVSLGLVLCNEFIKLNNGDLKVESEPAKGSKFIFTLPQKS